MAIEITESNFSQEVESSDLPVVLDAYAPWCGPCQNMAPIFSELSEELSNTYKFVKLNVDHARNIAIKLGITSIPTFVFFRDGKIVGKATGYMNKEDLNKKIQEHLG